MNAMKIDYHVNEIPSIMMLYKNKVKNTVNKKTNVTENVPKPGYISIASFMQPVFSYGNLVGIFGYNFKQIFSGEVIVTRRRALRVIVMMMQFSSAFHLTFLAPIMHRRKSNLDHIRKWVATLSIIFQFIMTITLYVNTTIYRGVYTDILNSMVVLQKNFSQHGLLPFFTLQRKRIFVAFFAFWFCVGILDFTDLLGSDIISSHNGIPSIFNRTNRFYGAVFSPVDISSYNVAVFLMTCQFILAEFLNWQILRYIACFLTIVSFVIREFYKTLNEAIADCSIELSLQNVMKLHRETTSLVHLVNKAVSSILLLYLLNVISTACKFLPSLLMVRESLSELVTYSHIYPSLIGLAFVLTSSVSINIQAKQASQWLENYPYSPADISAVSPLDFISFSNSINSNEIGLSGLGYFTITKRFVVTTISGAFTYIVLIAQLSDSKKE